MQINNLTKKFGKHVVFKDLSIEFYSGCSLLLGENGSGKSTLFKIIGGLIKEYEGTIDTMNTVSLALDSDVLFPYKSGKENIEYFLNPNEIKEAMKYIERFFMEDYINHKVKSYSNGMKKKLQLVIALAKNKSILLLDEPSNSLDSEAVLILKDLLKNLKKEKMILIASHDIVMFDLDLVDSVYKIENQKIIVFDSSILNVVFYKAKTLHKVTSLDYLEVDENGYYIFKINPQDIDFFLNEINTYVVMELIRVDSVNELYLRGIYEKNN